MDELSTASRTIHSFEVPGPPPTERLDVLIAAHVPGVSRSAAQRLIREGHVRVDGRPRPQGFRPGPGARIVVEVPVPAPRVPALQAESGDLDILFEDETLLAIAKRPGIVVHPGAGHRSGTLVNLLLASGRSLSSLGGPERAGLVHRLDRETSGVLLVAKDDRAHEVLARQFKERTLRKAYLALVLGAGIPDAGEIATAFGRRPGDRKQFTSRVRQGREAVTEYRTLQRGGLCALVLVRPRTGRTHQIRVHLAERGHPVVGDRVYGRAWPRPGSRPAAEAEALRAMTRVALHAWALRFWHPTTGEVATLVAPVPRDFRDVCTAVFGDDWSRALPEDPFQGCLSRV